MSEDTRLETAERWEDLIGRNSRSGIWHRLRHTLWAGLIAFAFFALSFFEPVDQLMWGVQSRISEAQPSGEFAYVSVEDDLADAATSNRRVELARVLKALEKADVERVYVDFVFDEAGSPRDDAVLRTTVEELGQRVAFVAGVSENLDGTSDVTRTRDDIAQGAEQFVNPDLSDILNFTWWIPREIEYADAPYETLASALLRGESDVANPIMVDYALSPGTIRQVAFEDLYSGEATPEELSSLAGKQVIVGLSRTATEDTTRIPGLRSIPRGIIAIYAAESHLAGRTVYIRGYFFILGTLIALAIASSIVRKTPRRAVYALLAVALPGVFVFSIFSGIRAEPANAGILLVVFAMLRLRFHWQRRAAMRDEETGLSTLRALEEDLAKERRTGHVIVAKVHGYERVLKLLPQSLQPTYIRKIAERLKATETDLELYAGAHYFAWRTGETSPTAIEDHLNGLRALFSAPLDIGGTPVDVGMTFGVARIESHSERAMPSAMAAVEETSEAHEPVRFAIERSQDEGLWDISLRSRIDAAMNNGEVYCLYQPKYALGSGTVAGVEALVRWDDSERGPIPPLVFVRESEKAGRIEQLTRYVLQSACTAGRLLHSRGHRISVSVNVSAIQCSDNGIVETVEESLKASGFPAGYLVLEVTETARIRDLSSAARVLTRLKELGVKLSMDDFGVGMANYETFYELPFDELKIDRLFIKNIQTDNKAKAIASSLVKMGSEARITVTAEGVEDPRDLAILEEIGCTQVQGFAISRPITLPNLLDFLEKRQKNMV